MAYAYIRNVTTAGTQRIDDTNKGYHAKAVLEGSVAEKIELKAGVEVIGQDFRRGLQSPSGDKTRALNSWIFSGFTEADLYANNNFVARVGARTEYDQNSGAWSVDPRISIAGKLGRHGQTSLAYGIFRQAPDVNHRLENQQLQSEQASHFILNYQLIEDNRTFRAEAYYKHYDHLVKFPRQDFSNSENSGNGYATGFEVFWRDNRTFRNIDYWISYSYLDTERDYLNYPVGATPSFASAHNFSAVYKHFVPRLKTQFGATYSLASPRPYNDPNSNTFNGGRTPFYADLSLNLSYLPKNFLIIHFSCTNVLGRDNIFGYEFSATPDTNGVYAGRPVRQAAPRFLFIGVFITLSRDKTMNQLPTL
jgi:outer membrane cobalamin receptor